MSRTEFEKLTTDLREIARIDFVPERMRAVDLWIKDHLIELGVEISYSADALLQAKHLPTQDTELSRACGQIATLMKENFQQCLSVDSFRNEFNKDTIYEYRAFVLMAKRPLRRA